MCDIIINKYLPYDVELSNSIIKRKVLRVFNYEISLYFSYFYKISLTLGLDTLINEIVRMNWKYFFITVH